MIDKEQKISQSTLDALESELYRNLRPLYPKTVIRIRKGSSNGVELTGLQLDEERKQVMKIMQKVWKTTAGCIKKRCWRLNLLLASARLNNEPLRGVSSVVHVYAA
ncbi:RecA filament binding protein DinI [Escherichia phage 500465-1]|uniref:RecA filament binding protein DinI n=1 Tax=Escherichia phage 500465-1 TaxID=2716351 RepID=UPI0018AD2479|nr:RecA filament binding protein DinI [Escherichia phage 500465-1]